MSRTFWLVSDSDRRRVAPNAAQRRTFRDNAIQITMYSVGDGEAIVVNRGDHRVLIDGGANARRKRNDELAASLSARLPPRSLCAIVASHPHQDHTNTYPAMIADHKSRFDTPAFYFDNDTSAAQTAFLRLQQAQPNLPIERHPIADHPGLDDLQRIPQLDPDADAFLLRASTNATTVNSKKYWSVMMLLRFRDAWMLFTGDAYKGYEKRLLLRLQALLGPAGRIHVLKVTHHGSSDGTSQQLVDALDPAIAIASTADDEGHQLEPDVRDRLDRCAIYATFEPARPVHKEKDIIVRTDGLTTNAFGASGVMFEVWRRKPALS